MNIFVLDSDPAIAAQMLCDKHVVKMILESAQLLSTTHRFLDGNEYIDYSKNGRRIKRWDHPEAALYKAVMINHPCTIWTRSSWRNYSWLAAHAFVMCKEYTYRYGKIHSAEPLIDWLRVNYPKDLPRTRLTPFAQAMPDQYKMPGNAVEAYRSYYIGEKKRFAKWTKRKTPEWFLTNDTTMVEFS